MIPVSTGAYDLLAIFVAANPRTDVQAKVGLVDQFNACLRAGWSAGELKGAALEYAELGGEASKFAWWATRQRHVRTWWMQETTT